MEKTKVRSIKTKIGLLLTAVVILTGLTMILTYSINLKKEMNTMTENYIDDLALAYGSTLDNEIKALGEASVVLGKKNLSTKLASKGMEDVESSYVYVAAKDGTMLYHPDEGKIGKPVENTVVKSACADLQAGKRVDGGVITYDYKGAVKYAALYISEYQEFILIVTADQGEIMQPIKKVNMFGAGGIVLAVALCMIIGYLWASAIVRPITHMTEMTLKISEMDFREDEASERLNQRKDEIGAMSRAVSVLRERLVSVVRNIRKESEVLRVAADELNRGASETANTMSQVENAVSDISQGAVAQAEETQAATESVMAMGSMVEETNGVVQQLVQNASRMKDAGDNAKGILLELAQVNTKAEEYIDVIAKQTDTTNESAQKISEAAAMITEIAEQTNLLSLNASIEAARAGEQGRGFSVVASQIQKLAEQSNESARQIGTIISVLLQDSKRAVEIMKDVKVSIKEQSDYVGRTDGVFGEIREEVDASVEAMHYILKKTNEMDDTRCKVVDGVQSLTAIAEENAAGTEETSASVTEISAVVADISKKSEELRRIAETLERDMNMFKI